MLRCCSGVVLPLLHHVLLFVGVIGLLGSIGSIELLGFIGSIELLELRVTGTGIMENWNTGVME